MSFDDAIAGDDEQLASARARTHAGADRVQAAFFEDLELPVIVDQLGVSAVQAVDRLQDRGVELAAAISLVVGGIAGTIARHYST